MGKIYRYKGGERLWAEPSYFTARVNAFGLQKIVEKMRVVE